MRIGRRDFLKYCGAGAAALGLSQSDLGLLNKALADPTAPSVVWLQGSGCCGCSISFLNRIAGDAPATAADVLIDSINLAYHPTLMGAAGEQAAAQAIEARDSGSHILVVEGGVPTAFGGAACWAWSIGGEDVTFERAVRDFAAQASHIVCVGTCSAYGGIPAAPPNPTSIRGVRDLTGLPTINISGCPPHPDWIVWGIVQLLLGRRVSLDEQGRPRNLYREKVHELCPRREREEAKRLGLDGRCLKEIGCRGPSTRGLCPTQFFNGGQNWCIGANALCLGCTEPKFPTGDPFHSGGEGGDGDDDDHDDHEDHSSDDSYGEPDRPSERHYYDDDDEHDDD